jgi:hypothetical protein
MYLPALDYWDEYSHNTVNPNTRGYSLIYVNIILLFFALFTFSLRIFTRTFISRSLGWDDLALTLGVIFTIGLSVDVALANLEYYWLVDLFPALSSYTDYYGNRGRHIWDVPYTLEALASVLKTQMAGKALFSAATFFTRVALLMFYYRLVVDSGLKGFKRALYAAFIFDFATFITFLLLAIFSCT